MYPVAPPVEPLPAPRRRLRVALGVGLLVLLVPGAAAVPWAATHPVAEAAAADDPHARQLARQVADELPALQAFVARERGLPFLRDVPVDLLGGAAFDRAFGEPGDEDADAGPGATLRGLGALGADGDAGSAEMASDDVSGFYDDESRRIVVRGERLSGYTRAVLVHELTHALQDQHFHLADSAPLPDGDEDELAYDALLEGDATRVEQAWYDAQPEYVQDEVDDEGGVGAEPVGEDAVEDGLAFPYYAGPAYVRAVLAAGGQRALDAAFAAPPLTTAQVLHPERGRYAVPVPAPTGLPTAPVLDRGVLGELGLAHLLGRDPTRPGPQGGWAGDTYATVDEPGGPCTYDDVRAVSAQARDRLAGALRTRRGVTVVLQGADGLRLRRCAA